ncbi:MAG TPA: RHS repeat-associated core domain-containing protein [Lacipirellulaceae bacterium]|nr:RHS repeat-associated core domain-containing protein [Lacipirellulaceae bacterium]
MRRAQNFSPTDLAPCGHAESTAASTHRPSGISVFDEAFGYTGRWFDTATGLQNNLNRWYDPQTGRFLSEDPTGFAGGDANLYRYAGNSPTNATDPTGLDPFGDGFPEGPPYTPYPIGVPPGPSGSSQYRPGVPPKQLPPGTKPIDKCPETRDKVHDIKKRLRDEGVGPGSWVGVSPGGDIIVTDPDGTARNLGPWQDYAACGLVGGALGWGLAELAEWGWAFAL